MYLYQFTTKYMFSFSCDTFFKINYRDRAHIYVMKSNLMYALLRIHINKNMYILWSSGKENKELIRT